MTVTDPVADMLTRIRNAIMAKHRYVDIPMSNLKEKIAKIMKQDGFILNYEVRKKNNGDILHIILKYAKGSVPVIKGLKRESKPGCRKYVKSGQIGEFFGKLGTSIISTSQGVMSGKEAAEKKIGGEFLCKLW